MPQVSILLPTYKDAPALSDAIESVILQIYTNWELIIIDDGLFDMAVAVAHGYSKKDQRIIVLPSQGNLGVQKSLNRGVRAAQGDYIARIDDDDSWADTTKLVRQVEFFGSHPDHVLVGTNATICDEKGNILSVYHIPTDDEAIRARMLTKNCFLHPTIMARKESIVHAGGYPETEETKHIEDYALWLELGLIGKFANLPEPMVQLTVHSQSMTFQNRISQVKRMSALIEKYKEKYPSFYAGKILLFLRMCGFLFLKVFPIPRKFLSIIQKIYKQI